MNANNFFKSFKGDTVVFDEMIETFPRHSGPDCDVEVLRMIIQNLRHFLRQVDANAAEHRRCSALQSGPGSVGDDRNRIGVTEFADLERFELKNILGRCNSCDVHFTN